MRLFGLKKLIIENRRFPQFHSLGQWSFSSPQAAERQPLLDGLNECATADGNAFRPMGLTPATESSDLCLDSSLVSYPKCIVVRITGKIHRSLVLPAMAVLPEAK